MSMASFSTQSAVGVEARIVPPGLTALYTRDGTEVWVPDAAVPRFLSEGFTVRRVDPVATAAELRAALVALELPIKAALDDVERDGQVYPSNALTAYHAVRAFADAWAQFARIAAEQAEEGVGVQMSKAGPDGASVKTSVDPGQVAIYVAQGWAVVQDKE